MKRRKNTLRKAGKRVVTLSESGSAVLPGRAPAPMPGAGPPPIRGPPLSEAAYISAPQLCARFGNRSHMWLRRLMQRDPEFPRPIRINRLRFFSVEALTRWERSTAAKSSKAA